MYLYLIHEREFVRLGERVFKIGRTIDIARRFSQYPKGSRLIYAHFTHDPVSTERRAIQHLCKTFRFRLDLGREYLEGDPAAIVRELSGICQEELSDYFTDASPPEVVAESAAAAQEAPRKRRRVDPLL